MTTRIDEVVADAEVRDRDGHVLEAPDLSAKRSAANTGTEAFKSADEHGFEYLGVDGKPAKVTRRGTPSGPGGDASARHHRLVASRPAAAAPPSRLQVVKDPLT